MIATCGWLMIAAVSTLPAEPLFEIVNVPPRISSGDSFRERGASREVVDLAGDRAEALRVGVADDRHEQTLVAQVDGDAEVDVVVDGELAVAHGRVQVRELGDRIDDRPR